MAHTVDSRSKTAANQLRESLDKADRLIVQINSQNVEEFLTLLDQIEQEFDRLSADWDRPAPRRRPLAEHSQPA